MSDQNLPDQNKSNQNMNAQPETASDQLAPDDATINGNLFVTGYVTVGPFAATTGQGGIDVTGPLAEFGFVRRDLNSFPTTPAAGDRFVWYNPDGTARLFTGIKGDLLTVTATGNVGIGTTNPEAKLHISDPSFRGNMKLFATSGVGHDFGYDGGVDSFFWFNHYGKETGGTRFFWSDGTKTTDLLALKNTGKVGIGTTEPSEKLEVAGNVKCVKLLETSSRESKENIAELSGKEAVEALKNLNPVKFNFKADSDKNLHLGFIAEDVPELVATSDRKTLSPMDIVAVLTQALKEQQNTISALAEKVKLLEAKTA
jgi:hypothetical protein